jgi:hypothetical protein
MRLLPVSLETIQTFSEMSFSLTLWWSIARMDYEIALLITEDRLSLPSFQPHVFR